MPTNGSYPLACSFVGVGERINHVMQYLRLRPWSEAMLRDALYHMDYRSGASEDYAKGLVVGVVSTLMAEGFSFEEAIDTVAQYMPHTKTTRLTVPSVWKRRLSACLLARGKMLEVW